MGLFKRKHNVLEAASIFTVTHIFRCTFHFVPVYAWFDVVYIFLKYVSLMLQFSVSLSFSGDKNFSTCELTKTNRELLSRRQI